MLDKCTDYRISGVVSSWIYLNEVGKVFSDYDCTAVAIMIGRSH